MMGNWFSSFRAVFTPNPPRRRTNKRFTFRRRSSQPKPPSRRLDYTDGGLSVPSVLSLDTNILENGRQHRTERFELVQREGEKARLVVRRGQGFIITLSLTRPFNPYTDAMSFIFTFSDADTPNHGQGTLIAIPLLQGAIRASNEWTAEIEQIYENIITVRITPSASCLVGKWHLEIDSKLLTGEAVTFNYPNDFFVLYNPWCEDDQVYLEGESLRSEYVLADTGIIWRGTANRMRPAVWKYAQFEKDVLECSIYLISKIGRVPVTSLGDAVKTSRAISAAVNSPDDNGAVLGNWSDDFGGGTHPTKWLGSMKILQKYWENKKPVKYGQCWVFAGVLTTIARAVGIPARTITCYSAAHDTQNSLTVDYFVDDKGKIMEELNSDSIWNFHVWNEVWMTRPDLGEGQHDGWQVVDATPQELSDDMYRCGPASVAAVKQGQVLRPYDGGFVFSEVNADKVFWKYAGPTQPLKLLRKDILGIGQLISTKTVGKWTREDITLSYKYPEKTVEERDTMLRALKQSENLFSRYYLNEEFNDLQFDFALRDDIIIGSPFNVTVIVKNKSIDTDYSVIIKLRVDAVTYTGKIGAPVKKQNFEQVIKAGTTEELSLPVKYEEYAKRLVDQGSFNIACLASVTETNFEYFAQDDFRVRKPDIKFKMNGYIVEGIEMSARAYIVNPLPVPIKKGEFRIEGSGIAQQIKIKLSDVVNPGEEFGIDFKFTPGRAGKATIIAKFVSRELDDVDGFLEFMVNTAENINGTYPQNDDSYPH